MKRNCKHNSFRCRGFTLVEVLAGLGITAVLAALLVVAAGEIRNQTFRVAALTNLRQVGMAVLAYAADNGGRLPGPSALGIKAQYRNWSSHTNLAPAIAPYLDAIPVDELAGGQTGWVEQLVCPLAEKQAADSENPPPYYIQNYTLPGSNYRILGRQPWNDSPAKLGYSLAQLGVVDQSASLWILTNLDQQLPKDMPTSRSGSITSSGWFSQLPREPVWGDHRLRLYLDAHVATVPLDAAP